MSSTAAVLLEIKESELAALELTVLLVFFFQLDERNVPLRDGVVALGPPGGPTFVGTVAQQQVTMRPALLLMSFFTTACSCIKICSFFLESARSCHAFATPTAQCINGSESASECSTATATSTWAST